MKQLVFTVTNDLNYDQRMIRICTSLAAGGYKVTLIGRTQEDSPVLTGQPFQQRRLKCFFNNGPAGYAEFNIRLFFCLLFLKHDLVCAIDLDTIMPCYFSSRLKGNRRVYDAHELFCEMKEVATRPAIYKFWKRVEKRFVPKFSDGYTVNEFIAEEFKRMYAVNYGVIRNMPSLQQHTKAPEKKNKYILYQGAVNEGRSFETLIPAMKYVDLPLVICGSGNFMQQAKELARQHGVTEKVIFRGKVLPADLRQYTENAWLGVTLFDKTGLSNYYSLANRFFDYMHAGLPQICVDYPVYRSIIRDYSFARLIDDLTPENIAKEINSLLQDQELYDTLQRECFKAREILNWQEEEKKLTSFYQKIFSS